MTIIDQAAGTAEDAPAGRYHDDELGPLSCDDMLGGEVRLLQPKTGYRVSMDTIMLQACVPAMPGQRVLEPGTGTGAAALCLARRIPGLEVVGLEIQPSLERVAQRNVQQNHLQDRVHIFGGCITAPPDEFVPGSFDHVMANPPYLDPGAALSSPTVTKDKAHMNSTATLKDWLDFSINMVKPKGTLSFIYRADRLHDLIYLLHGRVGELTICPLWPRIGAPAKRVIVQGRKGMLGVTCMTPGIALHGEVERYTEDAEKILRGGASLDLRAARNAHARPSPMVSMPYN